MSPLVEISEALKFPGLRDSSEYTFPEANMPFLRRIFFAASRTRTFLPAYQLIEDVQTPFAGTPLFSTGSL